MCWGCDLESISMHIGILRTDSVRPEWVPTFGEYPDMFERLLLAEDTALTFTTWNVEAGELPRQRRGSGRIFDYGQQE
jgi:GMP synthase (glutamine-hydrolysing)